MSAAKKPVPMPAVIAFLIGGFFGAVSGGPLIWLVAFFVLIIFAMIIGAAVTYALVKAAVEDIRKAER